MMTVKETLVQLALGTLSDDDRARLAKDTKSKKVLKILSKDKSRYVRYRVADNPNTPTDILTILELLL